MLWLATGQLIRLGINQAVARARPAEDLHLVAAGGYAFPSGRTTTATIGYGLVAVLLIVLLPTERRPVVIGAAALVGAVGHSRIYLGVHWPTDVMGGWALGVTWLCLAGTGAIGVQLLRTRRLLHTPRTEVAA